MKKVAICIPHYGDLKPNFTLDLFGLLGEFPNDRQLEVSLHRVSSSILLQGRHDLARMALAEEADYALFLDADMRFPRDSLLRLLHHNKPIIGANYTQRNPPHQPTASKDNKRLSSLGRSGIQEVDTVGFGVCLIATDVFRKVAKPWFMFGYNPRVDDYVGEDVYFFAKAKAAGFPAFVDHDLSQDVRHIGEVELDVDMSAIG